MSTDTTESFEQIDIPTDVGRNDPCPCGSGKKYKKCHMRIHQALSESDKKTRSITQLIQGSTRPYDAYKVVRDIHDNNLLALFFDAAHDLGPWRALQPEKDAFLLAASEGKLSLPASPSLEFLRMRIDEPDAHILLADHVDDPRHDHVSYQVLTLRRNEFDADRQPRQGSAQGWRIWDVKTVEIAKSELSSEEDGANIHLDRLEVGWHPRELRAPPTHVRPTEEEEEGEGAQQ